MKQTDTSRSREAELKETIKKLEDMEKPTAYSCRNPQATLLMLQVQAELKGIAEGRRLQKIEEEKLK